MMRFNRFEQWLTGTWWWRHQRRRAEKRMNDARLDDANAQLIHQKLWIPMDFAERYGRPAPPRVRKAVERASASGADPGALAVVVANRDITDTRANVVLRNEHSLVAITFATRTISILALAYWVIGVSLAPGAPLIKTLTLIGGLAFIGICASVWEFYGGKALRAMRAARGDLEQAILDAKRDTTQVIDIASRRRR